MYNLTVALAKGRLSDNAIELFERCGIDCTPLKKETRQLVLFDAEKKYRFIFVKPSDVPTYIERGIADIGVVGKDTLLEESKNIYEILDLGFGECRLCIAGYAKKQTKLTSPNLVVATKYVNIARSYYNSIGINADIIKLNGSVELAPITEMADVILDIVESGKTLEANGLCILEEICKISARLVANKVSLKTKSEIIMPLLEQFKTKLGS